MYYSPVSIKFKTDSSTEFVSGIYLCDEDTELVMSVCPQFISLFKANPQGELLVALGSSITEDAVVWDEISLLRQIDLPGTFFTKFPGFTRTPHELPALHVYRFVHRNSSRKASQQQCSKSLSISCSRSELVNAPVELLSCPFGGVNSALFIGYRSPGVVSYVAENSCAMLIDARFLDNMQGGMVVTHGGQSLGLIYGQLAKTGGEGKLVAAIPWAPILDTLKNHEFLPQLANCVHNPPDSAHLSSGVAVVNVKLRAGRQVWGSGVLVDRNILVTNKHVTGSDFLRIEVWFDDHRKYVVSAVSEPIIGVDLILLRLRDMPDQEPVLLATGPPTVGTAVTSQGFGLLAPGRAGPVEPLFSAGTISARYFGEICKTGGEQNQDCSLLVSNASCWNGSSGGGVFNHQNELVGIMASNARDESCNEIMPDMAFVIPVNIVHLALDCVARGTGLEASTQFQKLWKLEPTHTDGKRLRARL